MSKIVLLSRFCIVAGICLCASQLLAGTPEDRAVIADLEARRDRLQAELSQEWNSFHQRLAEAELTAEELVRRVDEWHEASAAKREQLAATTREISSKSTRPQEPAIRAKTPSEDPALASIEEKEIAIADAIDAARASARTAEEMIRKVDEAVAANQSLIEARDRERAALARRSAPNSTGSKTVTQTPEERIAEVDATLSSRQQSPQPEPQP